MTALDIFYFFIIVFFFLDGKLIHYEKSVVTLDKHNIISTYVNYEEIMCSFMCSRLACDYFTIATSSPSLCKVYGKKKLGGTLDGGATAWFRSDIGKYLLSNLKSLHT